MNRRTYHTQQGFIALFFTLSISAVLLVYVTVSSASVFDYMRIREQFVDLRDARQHTLACADMFIDMLVRSSVYSTSTIFGCTIHDVYVDQTYIDSVMFSFISDQIYITGLIKNGFVTKVVSSNFSL